MSAGSGMFSSAAISGRIPDSATPTAEVMLKIEGEKQYF